MRIRAARRSNLWTIDRTTYRVARLSSHDNWIVANPIAIIAAIVSHSFIVVLHKWQSGHRQVQHYCTTTSARVRTRRFGLMSEGFDWAGRQSTPKRFEAYCRHPNHSTEKYRRHDQEDNGGDSFVPGLNPCLATTALGAGDTFGHVSLHMKTVSWTHQRTRYVCTSHDVST